LRGRGTGEKADFFRRGPSSHCTQEKTRAGVKKKKTKGEKGGIYLQIERTDIFCQETIAKKRSTKSSIIQKIPKRGTGGKRNTLQEAGGGGMVLKKGEEEKTSSQFRGGSLYLYKKIPSGN